ncbi:glycoside hydrolase family 36 protein, partial [Treponema sp.]|uniref:glycoside hydrolase family 36 protein n=1 Tax=Treponema sp. TaxID=166 RepID=UPI00298D6DA5
FDSTLHLGKTPQGWESWYNHYADINEALILDDLESLGSTENIISLNRKSENSVREKKDSRPASDKKNTSSKADKKNTDAENSPCIFQIDDGWEKALGDWEWNLSRFPSGGKKMASTIKSKGYIPGLWLAPFIIDLRSDTARRHPEWILCDEKGKPVSAGYNPLWGANFGKDQPGFPGTFYCLDLSNEDVLTHLDKLMDTVINKWGFEYLKLDFLYAGMLNGNFVNEGAAYEHYDKAVKILTKRKVSDDGAKICYLGCGAPFEASFNDFPLCRIGCDTLEHWEDKRSVKMNWNGRTSCYLNMQDSIGRNIWNRTIFLNDPDVIFIRKNNCSLTDSEKKLVAIVAFLFGSQLMYSDDPASSSSPEEVKLAKEILAIKDELKNIQPCATLIEKRAYLITDEAESKESAKKKFILNLSDKTLSFEGLSVPAHSAANLEKKIIY